jgi:hypothetical protein
LRRDKVRLVLYGGIALLSEGALVDGLNLNVKVSEGEK